jgi:hypothetical protein
MGRLMLALTGPDTSTGRSVRLLNASLQQADDTALCDLLQES